jgi:20S proteasome subunit alpha 2
LVTTAKGGFVLATEKKLPPLAVPSSLEKIAVVTDHIGLVYAGMGPDSRVLVKRARKLAAQYKAEYGDPIPVKMLVRQVAGVMQEFTQSGGVRPFGVALLIAGIDADGTVSLFQVDPSGSYWAWKASAIGKGMLNAQAFLEKRYKDDDELDDCINMAILTLKEAFEGEMNENNVDIGVIDIEKRVFRVLSPAEVKDFVGL